MNDILKETCSQLKAVLKTTSDTIDIKLNLFNYRATKLEEERAS